MIDHCPYTARTAVACALMVIGGGVPATSVRAQDSSFSRWYTASVTLPPAETIRAPYSGFVTRIPSAGQLHYPSLQPTDEEITRILANPMRIGTSDASALRSKAIRHVNTGDLAYAVLARVSSPTIDQTSEAFFDDLAPIPSDSSSVFLDSIASLPTLARLNLLLARQTGSVSSGPRSRFEERIWDQGLLLQQRVRETELRRDAFTDSPAARVAADQSVNIAKSEAVLFSKSIASLRREFASAARSAAAMVVAGAVRAPYFCEVRAAYARQGQWINEGDALISVGAADVRLVWLKVQLEDPIMAGILIGMPVAIELEGAPKIFTSSDRARYSAAGPLLDQIVNRKMAFYATVLEKRLQIDGATSYLAVAAAIRLPRDGTRWLVRFKKSEVNRLFARLGTPMDSLWSAIGSQPEDAVVYRSAVPPLLEETSWRVRIASLDRLNEDLANSRAIFVAAGYPNDPLSMFYGLSRPELVVR